MKIFSLFQSVVLLIFSYSGTSDGQYWTAPVPDSPRWPTLPPPTERRSCYDALGRAQRCVPAFENAAYLRPVEATNTCGENPPYESEYCIQTPKTQPDRQSSQKFTCSKCRRGEHKISNVVDFNDNTTINTWWQSDTMLDGIEYPKTVNITLHLGKSYDVTYVRLVFQSPRPESFAIYKRVNETQPWVPFQYYSSNCESTFNVAKSSEALSVRPDGPLCSSDFSDISPLSGGNVVFSTLEGRPGYYALDRDPLLQKFVTATDIKIVLVRQNTFGDEIFREPQVLKTYYYAISDLSVGGRCKCNGHASECIPVDSSYTRFVCKCEHNTTGIDCEKCLPLYNDAEYGVATLQDVHECKPCNCNGRAVECSFDRDLYEKTGHGGRCINCSDNFDGPNCERCKDGFYDNNFSGICVPCNCDPRGSKSTGCSTDGQCICKPGVTGRTCDQCEANHYDFSEYGCKPCACLPAGSYNNTPTCDSISGLCLCKENVEGQRCDRCKPGFFDMQPANEFGCLACFCYGHSAGCGSAGDYSKFQIESNFYKDAEKWTARSRSGGLKDLKHNPSDHTISVTGTNMDDGVYFVAPNRFLGDQKASYNQFLKFTLRISEHDAIPHMSDVVLEGAGLTISIPIYGQGNPKPSQISQTYKYRLNEHPKYEWSPRLSSRDFISVLANLTAIKVRGTYSLGASGFIDEVKLESAQRILGGQPATWIERCDCPVGYDGQFCESCKTGYRHNPSGGGSFAVCSPCECNGYADFCDPYTAKCFGCQNNTGGDNCEVCARGFYGNPLDGTGCSPCPCPDKGPCVLLPDETIACLECPVGAGGARCEHCIDGYFGEPLDGKPCKKCDCKGNIDENAVGNCDSKTGDCIKCIYNTTGKNCEKCLPGFYGDALAFPKGDCQDCNCNKLGADMQSDEPVGGPNSKAICDDRTGYCSCKKNVMGRQCDRCVLGYFNLSNPDGCERCECNIVGSINQTCDEVSGQCFCRPGIQGLKCDQCKDLHYGFSEKGCSKCDCDPLGSKTLQCRANGQCECYPNVEGRRCERCRENKFNKEAGCIDCPPCYGLIQDSVNTHRSKLNQLKSLLEEIENAPTEVEDKTFESQLQGLISRVTKLVDEARRLGNEGKSLQDHLNTLKARLVSVKEMARTINGRIDELESLIRSAKDNMTLAESIIQRAIQTYTIAKRTADNEGRDALDRARERFRRFGQQSIRMSQISNQATELAKKHKDEAARIEQLVRETMNNSDVASRLVQDAIGLQSSHRNLIKEISDGISSTSDFVERTRKIAEEAFKEAFRVRTEALNLNTEVQATSLPAGEGQAMAQEADDLKRQASKLISRAESLMRRYQDVLNGTQIQLGDLRHLLELSLEQQNITAKMGAQVEKAFETARRAASSANETLQQASNTFKILTQFDQSVQESRLRAQEASKKIPEIRKMISDASRRTLEAEKALEGAQSDAIHANNTATKALEIAESAAQEATRLSSEAVQTKDYARKLLEESNGLNRTIDQNVERLTTLEEQAFNDDKLSQEAQDRANQAKTSAAEAKSKVDDAMKLVVEILGTLSGLEGVDGKLLENLEVQLSRAENEFRTADLNNRTLTLKTARDGQNQLVADYANEIDLLRAEVANIRQISEAIPTECLRRMRLEP